jgi:hypothetical protein
MNDKIGTTKTLWSDNIYSLETTTIEMIATGWRPLKALQPKFNWRKFRTMFFIKLKKVSNEAPYTVADGVTDVIEALQKWYSKYEEIHNAKLNTPPPPAT